MSVTCVSFEKVNHMSIVSCCTCDGLGKRGRSDTVSEQLTDSTTYGQEAQARKVDVDSPSAAEAINCPYTAAGAFMANRV